MGQKGANGEDEGRRRREGEGDRLSDPGTRLPSAAWLSQCMGLMYATARGREERSANADAEGE